MMDTAKTRQIILCVAIFMLAFQAQGQVQGKINFKETPDQNLTLRKILLLPAHDVMKGIYAGPLQEELRAILEKDHRREAIVKKYSLVMPADQWATNKSALKSAMDEASADGALALGVDRKSDQLVMGLYLYGSDQKLLLKKEIEVPQESTHAELKAKLPQVYEALIDLLPYQAVVLSRNKELVTVNVGSRNGVQTGDRFLAIKIIQLQRHPHFEFLMETEQEAIGSIEITKAAERSSFAKVVSEISPMIITESTKLLKTSGAPSSPGGPLLQTEENMDPIAFGRDPHEWRPAPLPSFGALKAYIGLYRTRTKTDLTTLGSQDTGSVLTPELSIAGDAWITARWTISAEIAQNISSFSNPSNSSTPADLSATLTRYNLSFLRRLYPSGHYADPSLELGLGYSKWQWSVDSTTPMVFTNWDLSGWFLQVRGQFPLELWPKLHIGGDFRIHLWPSLSESPVTTASDSENSITEFKIFTRYALNNSWWLEGALDLSLYSGRLSGSGSSGDNATALSYNRGGLKAGILYLF